MQSEEDVARAMEGERAFHTRLAEARHEMETNPNPYERRRAAAVVGSLTCHYVEAPRLPDDRLWFGSQWLDRRYDPHTPEMDRYFDRCRRLWREQVLSKPARKVRKRR